MSGAPAVIVVAVVAIVMDGKAIGMEAVLVAVLSILKRTMIAEARTRRCRKNYIEWKAYGWKVVGLGTIWGFFYPF